MLSISIRGKIYILDEFSREKSLSHYRARSASGNPISPEITPDNGSDSEEKMNR